MNNRTVLFLVLHHLLLALLPLHYCDAKLFTSCGNIHISFPFNLQDETTPQCQDRTYTLTCKNNRTQIRLASADYYVKEINYTGSYLRVVDVGIKPDDICSAIPIPVLTPHNETTDGRSSIGRNFVPVRYLSSVAFVNCDKPVKSNLFLDITGLCNRKNYSYVVAGAIDSSTSDLAETCAAEQMVITSSPLIMKGIGYNYSLADVYSELAYGFEVGWWFNSCDECRRRARCFDGGLDATAACTMTMSCFPSTESKFHRRLRRAWPFIFWYSILGMAAIIAARCLCAPCVYGFLIYKFKRRHLSTFDSIEGYLRSNNNLAPIRYSYRDIKKMTNNFKNKLGEGGYGTVYKGRIRSGHLVAVKMLSKPKADGQEFINEVATIGRIHHVNVVKLIGFCAESSKRALVYDFMPNGSLEKYIFSKDERLSLSCEQAYKISLGVARGMDYLHQGCEMKILHFDIKPHNILLDENFAPKVSDFGLAKLYPTEDSIVSLTAARGTMGYMAPELFYKNIGGVSYKADVYSFGMLLMEMAGRRRNWNFSLDSNQDYFPSWVYDQLAERKEVDMGVKTEEEKEMLTKMLMVALWCIQLKPSDRPSMNKVVEMLQGSVESLQMAPKPFLYPEAMSSSNNPGINSSSLSGACMDSISIDLSGR